MVVAPRHVPIALRRHPVVRAMGRDRWCAGAWWGWRRLCWLSVEEVCVRGVGWVLRGAACFG